MFGYGAPMGLQQPPSGRWIMVNSFSEIQSAPVPMDGSQTIFMLANEPIFYVVSIVNGQKMLQPYTFTALTQENRPTPPATLEDRMDNLEQNVAKISELLERSKQNESNIQSSNEKPANTAGFSKEHSKYQKS